MPEATGILLKNAWLLGRAHLSDVFIRGGKTAGVYPSEGSSPACEGGQNSPEVYDLDGRYLLPGLWDHHVHFSQWVAQRRRLDLSESCSAAHVLEMVRIATRTNNAETLVGYGFRDGLWPDSPSLATLDAVESVRPVALVSADLHCGWLNTPAFERIGRPMTSSGLLREEEFFGVINQLQSSDELPSAAYRDAAVAAARRGVVGVVEFENADNPRLWPQRVEDGVDQLRIIASIRSDHLDAVIDRGLHTGDRLDSQGLVTMGPLKVVVDGSLNTRTAWCWEPYPGVDQGTADAYGTETVSPTELYGLMAQAQAAGLSAAIHAIGDRANSIVLDTFAELDLAGTVEHAQLIAEADFRRFGELGLVASVQPEHAMDDRSVADLHWSGRTDRAFALASLAGTGGILRFGSDAPVAPLDPWLAIASAVYRSRGDDEPWHAEQRLEVASALAASTRGREEVQVGDPADLVVVERNPLTASRDELRKMPVAATLLAGEFTWFCL